MSNSNSKDNLSRGSRQSGDAGPYRKDTFRDFVDWCSMTAREKRACKTLTAKAFAAKHDVQEAQLSRWKQREDFRKLKIDRIREKWTDLTPDIFEALFRRIRRYGMASDVAFWLEVVEGWNHKVAIEEKSSLQFGENDIRTMVEFLPSVEKKLYYDTLSRLLVRAEESQRESHEIGLKEDYGK